MDKFLSLLINMLNWFYADKNFPSGIVIATGDWQGTFGLFKLDLPFTYTCVYTS